MTRVPLPGTDISASQLSLGTAFLGVETSDSEVAALINAYRDAGGNFLDTAHVYAAWTPAGAGSSERAIARYVKANGKDDLVVATKGGHPPIEGYRRVDRWLDPCRVHADIEDSLGRLNTDRIDLYYLHRDDTRFTVAEIIEMLNDETNAGTIAAVAASNWTHARLAAANTYAAENGYRGFVASQVQWSLAVRDTPEPKPYGDQGLYAQDDDIAFHEATGLPLCAYTATAGGYFASDPPPQASEYSPESGERARRARELAAQKGATPTQIALAWLMHQRFPCVPITGTLNVDHLRENIGAADVVLSADEVAWLA
jgi:aryl-alcohol dehydrogenase-like predicted oxidoreductase